MAKLELDQDLPQQERLWRRQRVGRALLCLGLLAALSGVCGSGPLADREVADGGLQVHYQWATHRQAPTEVEVQLASGNQLWVSRQWADDAGIEHVLPEPESVESSNDRLTYTFNIKPPAQVTFTLKHERPGLRRGTFGTAGGESVELVQVVYP
jgi:hypothetical protein